MAKKRQSIRDIQAALKGNTSFIGSDQEARAEECDRAESRADEPIEEVVEVVREVLVKPTGLVLDDARSEKLRILAGYQHVTPEELLELAVDDLLDLRKRQLAAAMEAQGAQED